MGMDAPRTLKEKLAELKENNEPISAPKKQIQQNTATDKTNDRPSSQNSISVISEKVPQLGENTIEMAAIEKLQEEQKANENHDSQQA